MAGYAFFDTGFSGPGGLKTKLRLQMEGARLGAAASSSDRPGLF